MSLSMQTLSWLARDHSSDHSYARQQLGGCGGGAQLTDGPVGRLRCGPQPAFLTESYAMLDPWADSAAAHSLPSWPSCTAGRQGSALAIIWSAECLRRRCPVNV